MKPSDHPDFFLVTSPDGRSRESSIRLDGEGRFWHDGELIAHPGVAAAMHSWIGRHPGDGRYVLTNGYDWTYFTVDDAPYFVRALRAEPERLVLILSDATEEAWDPESTRIGAHGALYANVKSGAGAGRAGSFEAKFTRHAQSSLGPLLVEASPPAVRIFGRLHAIGARWAEFG
jgi:hypothetical protein